LYDFLDQRPRVVRLALALAQLLATGRMATFPVPSKSTEAVIQEQPGNGSNGADESASARFVPVDAGTMIDSRRQGKDSFRGCFKFRRFGETSNTPISGGRGATREVCM